MTDTPVTIGTERFASLLGRPVDTDKAKAAIEAVFLYARAHTRGNGEMNYFVTDSHWKLDAAPDIAAVVVAAAARLYVNPAQMEQYTSGPYSSRPPVFRGWTLAERAVLDRYRKKVAA